MTPDHMLSKGASVNKIPVLHPKPTLIFPLSSSQLTRQLLLVSLTVSTRTALSVMGSTR